MIMFVLSTVHSPIIKKETFSENSKATASEEEIITNVSTNEFQLHGVWLFRTKTECTCGIFATESLQSRYA